MSRSQQWEPNTPPDFDWATYINSGQADRDNAERQRQYLANRTPRQARLDYISERNGDPVHTTDLEFFFIVLGIFLTLYGLFLLLLNPFHGDLGPLPLTLYPIIGIVLLAAGDPALAGAGCDRDRGLRALGAPQTRVLSPVAGHGARALDP